MLTDYEMQFFTAVVYYTKLPVSSNGGYPQSDQKFPVITYVKEDE